MELDALLDAIRQSPVDDLPRLALSDWCMEQSDDATHARGEMIQLRVRAAASPSGEERGAMERRVASLREHYETEWLGGLAPLIAGWDFERGMILVEVTSSSLQRGRLERMMAKPGWKWVIGLKGVLLRAPDAALVAGSRLLEGLTSLDLTDCELGAAGVRSLSRAGALDGLTSLKLGYTGCGDEGVAALADAPGSGRWSVLALCNNGIGPAGAGAIASSPRLGRLTHLDLSRNPLGDEGARLLAHSPNLPVLTHLALAGCGIGDRGGVAFADSSQRAALRELNLCDNPFGKSTRRDLSERYGPGVLLT
jgi:uncharacterized protein (TIGR02996 family)